MKRPQSSKPCHVVNTTVVTSHFMSDSAVKTCGLRSFEFIPAAVPHIAAMLKKYSPHLESRKRHVATNVR